MLPFAAKTSQHGRDHGGSKLTQSSQQKINKNQQLIFHN